MEVLAKRIEQILIKFTGQEIGNRLSEFAMLALKEIILNEIKNYKVSKTENGANIEKEKK
ncbi:hypothetical protein ES702_06339 [subsurface metagenome]